MRRHMENLRAKIAQSEKSSRLLSTSRFRDNLPKSATYSRQQLGRACSVSLEEGLYLRNPYFPHVESYISKVTTAGQLTLPKKIRKALGLGGPDYVEVALLGRTAVIRRRREDDEFLEAISKKVMKTGLTRGRMQDLLH